MEDNPPHTGQLCGEGIALLIGFVVLLALNGSPLITHAYAGQSRVTNKVASASVHHR